MKLHHKTHIAKTQIISLRCTAMEAVEIDKEAKDRGLTRQDILRERVFEVRSV